MKCIRGNITLNGPYYGPVSSQASYDCKLSRRYTFTFSPRESQLSGAVGRPVGAIEDDDGDDIDDDHCSVHLTERERIADVQGDEYCKYLVIFLA